MLLSVPMFTLPPLAAACQSIGLVGLALVAAVSFVLEQVER